jgi:hypothetical protein
LKVDFLFIRGIDFQDFRRNTVIYRQVREFGTIRTYFGYPGIEKVFRSLNKLIKLTSFIPIFLKCLFSKKSLIFMPGRLDNSFFRFLVRINGLSGRTYTHMVCPAIKKNEEKRYFDEKGNLQPGIKNKKKTYTGNGFLVLNTNSICHLNRIGYTNCKVIGNPLMFTNYQKYIRNNYLKFLRQEFNDFPENRTIVGIMFNKYHGKWAGRDDDWARNTLKELVETVLFKYPDSFILLRAHPMNSTGKVKAMIRDVGYPDLRFTTLSPVVISCASKVVFAIAQSSTYSHVMCFGTPYIEFGVLADSVYELIPEGSLYWDLGVKVTKTRDELIEAIEDVESGNDGVDVYMKMHGHQNDLSLLFDYWDEPKGVQETPALYTK